MKDKRLIIAIGAVVAVALIGCCVLAASGTVVFSAATRLFSGSAKPDHYGVYLKRGRGFVELEKYRGAPAPSQTQGIPSTASSRPTLFLWDPTITLSYLELYEPNSDWYGEYTIGQAGEMVELTPRNGLSRGRYCLVQGDPLGLPTSLSHWCFEVE
jgi:hypothetical protein